MKTTEIITIVVAVYGAVLSTVVMLRQVFSDRVKVRVCVDRNMQVVGDPKYKGVTLTRIQVVNLGRRPVTITTMGAIALHPNRKDLVAIDTNPTLPCELSEGKYVTSLWPQSDLDFSRIDYWAAWDSKGNIHKLREASLLKHWKSEFGWRRELRRKRAASSSL